MDYVKIVIMGIKALIAILTAYCVTGSFLLISKKHLLVRGIENIYEHLYTSGEKRKVTQKRLRQLYGNMGHADLLSYIDTAVRYSGIQIKYGISTEIYIVMLTILMAAGYVVVAVGTKSPVMGLTSIPAVIIISEAVLGRMRRKRYDAVQNELLIFINSVGTYSAITNDIMQVLEKSAAMVSGPIHEEVMATVGAARGSGNSVELLRSLEDRVEHPFFKRFIRNLEIASRHSANYADIVDESRNTMESHITNSEELTLIYRKGREKLACILAAGIGITVMMVTGILDMSPAGFYSVMMSGTIGRIIMTAAAAVIGISSYYAFIKSEQRR